MQVDKTIIYKTVSNYGRGFYAIEIIPCHIIFIFTIEMISRIEYGFQTTHIILLVITNNTITLYPLCTKSINNKLVYVCCNPIIFLGNKVFSLVKK